MAAGSDWRAGDAEREAVATALGMHLAAGRLTMEEFRSRLDAVYAATTAADLAQVTADLPAAGFGAAGGAGTGGPDALDGIAPEGAAGLLAHGRRALTRILAAAAVLTVAGFTGMILLIGALLGHGSLLVAGLVLLLVPLALVAALTTSLVWAGRRAWRSGAWLEMAPAAAGAPWAGPAARGLRVLAASRVLVRLARLAGRPVRRTGRAGRTSPATRQQTAWYQEPGGEWRQARVGDLKGTTR